MKSRSTCCTFDWLARPREATDWLAEMLIEIEPDGDKRRKAKRHRVLRHSAERLLILADVDSTDKTPSAGYFSAFGSNSSDAEFTQ